MSVKLPDPSFLKWPSNAPDDYITARRALLEKEYALSQQIEAVAAERRALPAGPGMPEYSFDEGPKDLNFDGPFKKITLAEIVKQISKPLLVYHMMMGESDDMACSGCSMFLDSINGAAKHLNQRVNLNIVAKAPLPVIRAYTKRRNWNDLRFLSSFSNSFNKDMGVEAPDWMSDMAQVPGFSVFISDEENKGEEGGVRFLYQTTPMFGRYEGGGGFVIRGMDLLTPVWNIFDLTPVGRGEDELEYLDK